MKKAIAILAVLVILVGAVFAAETHKIKIQAVVNTVEPQYQMVVGNVKTNNSKVAYTDTAYTVDTVAQTLNFEVANTVEVIVNLANAAKTTTAYTLTFSDGAFAVKKGADEHDATVSPKSITLSSEIEDGTTGIDSVEINQKVATVNFNGTTCANSTELVKATYSYDADTAVNPGTYSAYVQMVVAAV